MSFVKKTWISLINFRFLNLKNIENIYLHGNFQKKAYYTINFRRNYASKQFPTHQIINMPALSPTMTCGTIGAWKKNVGDSISPGEVLVEIETDKAQVDFEFQEEGYIAKILLESGTKDVNIGSPIAILVEEESNIAAFSDFTVDDIKQEKSLPKEGSPKKKELSSKDAEKTQEIPSSSNIEVKTHTQVFASPVARLLAAKKGISLHDIKGSGPNGRIIKEDVENFKPISIAQSSTFSDASYTDIPLSNIRRTIATRLTESKQSIPHFYITVTIVMDKLIKLRETLNNRGDGRYRISINDIILKASAIALQKVPEVNSGWFGEFIRQYHSVDISVAVSTPTGLITPIIKNVQHMGLLAINNKVKELGNKAREGKLKPEEYQGGTFTVSNMGMYGVEQFTSIINPPQSSILAVGSIEDFLVEDLTVERQFRTEKRMKVTLSSDHRVVDGAVAAKWVEILKSILENPLDLLL